MIQSVEDSKVIVIHIKESVGTAWISGLSQNSGNTLDLNLSTHSHQ